VVPQARRPGARLPGVPRTALPEGEAGSHVPPLPSADRPIGVEASSLMTTEPGVAGVRELLTRSVFIESELKPLGVTSLVRSTSAAQKRSFADWDCWLALKDTADALLLWRNGCDYA
jgi:hypothetical protein